MAPEIIRQEGFDQKADIWSLGATVYEMLTGNPPFWDRNSNQWMIMHKIAGTDEFPVIDEDQHCQEARDFVMDCLKRNPQERPTAKELLDHNFIKITDEKKDKPKIIFSRLESSDNNKPKVSLSTKQINNSKSSELIGESPKPNLLLTIKEKTSSFHSLSMALMKANSMGSYPDIGDASRKSNGKGFGELTEKEIQYRQLVQQYSSIDKQPKLKDYNVNAEPLVKERSENKEKTIVLEANGISFPSLSQLIRNHPPKLPPIVENSNAKFEMIAPMDMIGTKASPIKKTHYSIYKAMHEVIRKTTNEDSILDNSVTAPGYDLDASVFHTQRRFEKDTVEPSPISMLRNIGNPMLSDAIFNSRKVDNNDDSRIDLLG